MSVIERPEINAPRLEILPNSIAGSENCMSGITKRRPPIEW